MGGAALSALHLARRFVGALDPRGPGAVEEGWATAHLLPAEAGLWCRMSGPDRRHALAVARAVVDRLGDRASRPVVAAALLHDVGKVEARLGTLARVPATLVGMAARAQMASRHGRIATYLRHDEVGADLLAASGSDRLTVVWAREHHLPPDRWSLDPALAAVLKEADGD